MYLRPPLNVAAVHLCTQDIPFVLNVAAVHPCTRDIPFVLNIKAPDFSEALDNYSRFKTLL
ncbi:MAG: hypothetical protein ACJAQ6_002436 [Arenicella sp.]|jgi:hypothetical protein